MILTSHRTEDAIKSWFQGLQDHLAKQNAIDLLQNGQRIFNCDENGFPLCVTPEKVLAEKGVKHVYQRVTNNRKQLTALACMNAAGDYTVPFIIFSGKRIRNVDIEAYEEALYGTSESGWMTSTLFMDFRGLLDSIPLHAWPFHDQLCCLWMDMHHM